MRVEPGGDKHQLRREPTHGRLDVLVERAQPFLVSATRSKWNVHGSGPALAGGTRSGIDAVLVQRDVEHGSVALENVLRPVAVMHVEVDDRDTADVLLGLHVPRGDRDVV